MFLGPSTGAWFHSIRRVKSCKTTGNGGGGGSQNSVVIVECVVIVPCCEDFTPVLRRRNISCGWVAALHTTSAYHNTRWLLRSDTTTIRRSPIDPIQGSQCLHDGNFQFGGRTLHVSILARHPEIDAMFFVKSYANVIDVRHVFGGSAGQIPIPKSSRRAAEGQNGVEGYGLILRWDGGE